MNDYYQIRQLTSAAQAIADQLAALNARAAAAPAADPVLPDPHRGEGAAARVPAASQTQAAMLRQGRARWNAYAAAQTDLDPGWRADLRFADLRGADLRGANLRQADLHAANLREADLAGAAGANLYGAELLDADLSGAHLADADLRFATLNTDAADPAAGLASEEGPAR